MNSSNTQQSLNTQQSFFHISNPQEGNLVNISSNQERSPVMMENRLMTATSITLTIVLTGIIVFLAGLILFSVYRGGFGRAIQADFLKHFTKLTIITPVVVGGMFTLAGGLSAMLFYSMFREARRIRLRTQ